MMDPAKSLDSSSGLVVTGTHTNTAVEGTTPTTKDVNPGTLKFSKGIENAKKRLRAFSIQKKNPITPVVVPKPSSTGGTTTVLIGKLSNVKPTTPKVDDEQKKIPKPPKPGSHKKCLQDSYVDLQKRTLAEIEDMKRKMELVELGIPLGLICPTSSSEKAMPTKAMPPIKHFLDPAKVDEIIREAKKARDEGKKYKFDYQKLLPNYDNPFQRKKDEDRCKTPEFRSRGDFDRNKRKSDRYDSRRHSDHRRDDRDRYRTREKDRDRERTKEKNYDQEKEKKPSVHVNKEVTETNVNISDYLICDSWSIENEDRNSSSPKSEDTSAKKKTQPAVDLKCQKAIPQLIRDSALKNRDMLKEYTTDSPVRSYIKERPLIPLKIEKLQPVIDSFKFEIDPNDEEILDIFDEDSGIEKYARKEKIHTTMYSPTDMKLIDYEQDESKDVSVDDTNDDNFLESVINEIKQDDINEDISQDKGLVEYDISPVNKGGDDKKSANVNISVTPEIDDTMRDLNSERSDYSDSYRSNESGYKTSDTTESGYKSVDSFRISMEKELNEDIGIKMSKSTVDSLETWSFVLKICQPILFRHDKNKCYRETHVLPKLWYTENPKMCNCVKDRKVVYEELQLCKMNLVDRVYGCDQIPDAPSPKCRNWYPRPHLCLTESHTVPVSKEWEGEEMRQNEMCRLEKEDSRRKSNTPQQSDEVCLDSEYQRFMKAVWPDVSEANNETPRSTTPVRLEGKKKKREEVEKEAEVKKSAKKIKLSSEGWSQESDLEEEMEKSKKMKIDKEKLRKRKRSSSTLSSFSDSEPEMKKKKKSMKKNVLKKSKWKSAKRRRIGKKILRKLKEKEKKKKRSGKIEKVNGSDYEDDSDKKISKKLKKKKQQKLKKKNLKRKKKEVSMSSSSSSSSDSSSDESEKRSKKSKRSGAKKKKDKRRKRKSTSDSAQSEELFDVNILNNIKTERLTDDEKTKSLMDFSPRRQQKPREIINVKELQNDFVGNNIHIKKETIEETKNLQEKQMEIVTESDVNLESPVKITEISKEEEEANDVKDKQHNREAISEVSSTVSLISPTISHTVSNIDVTSAVPSSVPKTIPTISQIKPVIEESNMSQCSSQESVCSVKPYEKDDSHLRPSSQNSNYSFNDVINASQSGLYQKGIEQVIECDEKFHENYQQDNYEMFEHLAMAYQSDVASHQASPPCATGEQRIETVVRARSRGEIKCDWRAGLSPALLPPPAKPSRWGLKPGEVNIVLTGGSDYAPQPATSLLQQQPQPLQQQQQSHLVQQHQPQLVQQQQPQLVQQQTIQPAPTPQLVYKIQSLANRTDVNISGYDEAYMDMYGAADRLQYGDCFSEGGVASGGMSAAEADVSTLSAPAVEIRTSTLDARIDYALKTTVLGEVAKEVVSSPPDEREAPEKGILIMSGITTEPGRVPKRVSFADGYKPGQDSDVEEPPVKKKKKVRRSGCAWPCPATHPDHVALWDALPPPPPPPGSPPPPVRAAPPLHLLRAPPSQPGSHLPHRPTLNIPMGLPPRLHKIDTNSPLPVFIPTEPPPSLVNFP